MGYPMTYPRVVSRNALLGTYANALDPFGSIRDDGAQFARNMIAGDLRRLELDQRDERHLAEYAERAGVTVEQAKAVLDLFFTDFGRRDEEQLGLAQPCWPQPS